MRVGFIGLGNVGGKLAGSLLRNGFELTVRDLDIGVAQPLLSLGAKWADSPAAVASESDMVITCFDCIGKADTAYGTLGLCIDSQSRD